MSTSLVVNGVSYLYPDTGDQSWGTVASAWAAAVTTGMLQKAGGTFQLTADVNFGSNYGVLSKYFTSVTASSAATGVIRLANTELVAWRNGANNADIGLSVNASDELLFDVIPIIDSSGFVPVVSGGTGIGGGTSGGILGFTGTGTIASSALLTANQLIIGGGVGVLPTTLAAGSQYQVLRMGATTPAYGAVSLDQAVAVSGILPNANTTAASANTASAIVSRDGSGNFSAGTITAALTGTASGNTTYTPNQYGVVLSGAANAMVVLAPSASTVLPLVSGGAGANPSWAALTETGGGTGQIAYTTGDVLYASASNVLSKLPIGSNGFVLGSNGTTPVWVTAGGTGTVTSVAMSVPAFLSVSGSPIVTTGTLAVTLSGTALPVANGGTGTTTAFTTGSVVFAGASGVYFQDNAGLFFDPATDRLGIGTASPETTLDVRGNVQVLNTVLSRSGNDLILEAGGTNRDIFFKANSTTYMTLQGVTACVGIGSTSPTVNGGYIPRLQLEATFPMLVLNGTTGARKWGVGVDSAGLFTIYDSTGSADRLFITTAGRIYGSSAIHRDLGTTQDSTSGTTAYIESGTYTPTLFNTTNVAASTAYACKWMRVGRVVTVSGKVDIDPTSAAGTGTFLGISLPITSNLTAEEQCAGTASTSGVNQSAIVYGDTTNDRAVIEFSSQHTNNLRYMYQFTYLIQ